MSYSFNGKVYKTELNMLKAKQKLLNDHNIKLLNDRENINQLDRTSNTTMSRKTQAYKDARAKVKKYKDELLKIRESIDDTNTTFKDIRWNSYEHQRMLHNARSKRYYERHKGGN